MPVQGSSFCYNANVNCMPCSSTNSFRSLHCFFPPPPKPCNVVLARASRGNKLPSGRPLQHPLEKNPHMLLLMSCQAKGIDIEGNLSAESVVLDEQTLQRVLQIAIEEENYAEAAKIRDDLRVLHEDSKASVLASKFSVLRCFQERGSSHHAEPFSKRR